MWAAWKDAADDDGEEAPAVDVDGALRLWMICRLLDQLQEELVAQLLGFVAFRNACLHHAVVAVVIRKLKAALHLPSVCMVLLRVVVISCGML